MRANDAHVLGRLLDASHASLRDDFQVSNRELDAIVEIAAAHPACFGARMTGAGFGGCAVALVADAGTRAFVESVTAGYTARTGLVPRIYVCRATNGAEVVARPLNSAHVRSAG